MGEDVEVSLELGGLDKNLIAVLSYEEMKNKTVKDIVDTMLNKKWEGEDRRVCECTKRTISRHHGYRVYQPKLEQLELNEKIENYIQKNYIQSFDSKNQLRLCIQPNHIL